MFRCFFARVLGFVKVVRRLSIKQRVELISRREQPAFKAQSIQEEEEEEEGWNR